MFRRFTQQETGLPIQVRAARVVAVARTEDGGSRIFLGGALSCLVTEDDDDVVRAIEGPIDEPD
ncbi:MAG: hypothetical protein DCF29_09390 [Alphaproteobacteria bacterium]|nr:MAG: hypothetical protein DCF29_09390 [Alphaproteobacteria bacterium]